MLTSNAGIPWLISSVLVGVFVGAEGTGSVVLVLVALDVGGAGVCVAVAVDVACSEVLVLVLVTVGIMVDVDGASLTMLSYASGGGALAASVRSRSCVRNRLAVDRARPTRCVMMMRRVSATVRCGNGKTASRMARTLAVDSAGTDGTVTGLVERVDADGAVLVCVPTTVTAAGVSWATVRVSSPVQGWRWDAAPIGILPIAGARPGSVGNLPPGETEKW